MDQKALAKQGLYMKLAAILDFTITLEQEYSSLIFNDLIWNKTFRRYSKSSENITATSRDNESDNDE